MTPRFWMIDRPVPAAPSGGKAAGTVRRLPLERRGNEDDLAYCQRRIREEEALAAAAGSWEAGLVHDQTAMLYRAQLAMLSRPRGAFPAEAEHA